MKNKWQAWRHSKDENTQSVITNILGSFGVKACSMLVALGTTPAYMYYFGNQEMLGVWFTILSVLAWILNCDMGIGNGLRQKVVEAIAEKDHKKVKEYIASAYVFLVGILIVIIGVLFVVSKTVHWNAMFNISETVLSKAELNGAMTIFLVSIALQFVLRLITSILYALQKAFVPGLLNLITNTGMLIFVLVCNVTGNNNNITLLAFAYLVAVNLPLLIATLIVFSTTLKEAKPALSSYNREYAMNTLKIGSIFLWLQLMSMILNSTNSYLVTLFLGNAQVVNFQIYFRIFTTIGSILAMMTTPIWSAVTKAKSEQNFKWMQKLYRKMTLVGCLAMIGEFTMVIPLQFVFNIWLGNKTIQVNYGIAICFAVSGSLLIWSSIITNFVNGLGTLKIQMIFATLGAIINIPLAYVFAELTHSYVAIVLANIISYLPYCIIQTISLNQYLKRKTAEQKFIH